MKPAGVDGGAPGPSRLNKSSEPTDVTMTDSGNISVSSDIYPASTSMEVSYSIPPLQSVGPASAPWMPQS